VVPSILVAALIRFGNLMNSEIYGVQTSLPWGFIFERNGETLPKHPTQLYEALCYLLTFAVIQYMYWKTKAKDFQGMLGFVLAFVLIGFAILLATLIWYIVRTVKGMQALSKGAPYPNPDSWGF
jgi:prolipoprotein diacylglyceryltransferase